MTEPKCSHCNDTGWLDALGPYRDGSYITSRPCDCEAYDQWSREWHRAGWSTFRATRAKKANPKDRV